MSTPYGGRGMPPFDPAAQSAIHTARTRMDPGYQAWPHALLTHEEREEAQKTAEDEAKVCRFCIGIHAQPSGPGCPRLSSFKLNGDGEVIEGTFFPGTDWAEGRVLFVEDGHEDGEDGDDAD